ncbi:hypothetical protein SUNI508_14085 [Seiridium unicorne]|uniref:Uncharacterized protein n=1 Tax=Seiridium unicorne TaxID=138068 RepID=A0ABR2V068_9PEZI
MHFLRLTPATKRKETRVTSRMFRPAATLRSANLTMGTRFRSAQPRMLLLSNQLVWLSALGPRVVRRPKTQSVRMVSSSRRD